MKTTLLYAKINNNSVLKNLSLLILGLILLLPKINIISVSGSNTGIRVDDFLLFFFFVLYLVRKENFIVTDKKARQCLLYCCLFFVSSFLSIIFGLITGLVPSVLIAILAWIRKFEYFICFFIGYSCSKHECTKKELENFLLLIYTFLAILAFLQIAGIIGSFNMGKYDYTFGDRPSATFNGAYEYGAYLLLMLPYFLYDFVEKRNIKDLSVKYSIFLLTDCVLILFTQSRISVIALILILGYVGLFKTKGTIKTGFLLLCIIFIAFFVIIPLDSINILERFTTINFKDMGESISYLWKNKNYDALLNQYDYINNYAFTRSDPSFVIRFSKWFDCIDGLSRDILFGIGLNSFPTLDGNWTKILCENGIVGFFIFVLLCFKIYSFARQKEMDGKSRFIICVAFSSLLIGAIFIDILESSKCMEFFWFVLGYTICDFEKLKKTKGKYSE